MKAVVAAPAVNVRTLWPTTVPAVHPWMVTRPFASLTTEAGTPLPPDTRSATATPARGLSNASLKRADGGERTSATRADREALVMGTIFAAAPAFAFAAIVTG